MNQVLKACSLYTCDASAAVRYEERDDHAPAHRFAMQQNLIACCLLNGVAYCVAEVQDHAKAVLALIAIHHSSLHANRSRNYLLQGLWIATEHFVYVLFHESD